QTTGKIACR
ncbi:autoinducer 2 sensor kinase/phosphatase LuxQ domain protein, partial [Vibrio parahaemolyticus V-223/04]